jgi:hypothetical protein
MTKVLLAAVLFAAACDSNALATLSSQSIVAGGNYTVVSTGSAASPTLFMFDNTFSRLVSTPARYESPDETDRRSDT